MGSEDLEFCKFYKYLQSHFRSLCEDAQDRQFCICVPRNESVLGVEFDLNFVEFHILKPSPFFKGHFNTSHLANPRTVIVEGNYIIKQEGFEERSKVEILREELGYNKKYLPYKILIIDKPLVPVIVNKVKEAQEKHEVKPLQDVFLHEECLAFLQSYPECREILIKTKEDLTIFGQSYLVIPGYLSDASSRLQKMYETASQEFLDGIFGTHKDDERFVNNVHRSVENIILHETYDKVFGAVCKECAPKERQFLEKLHTLRKVSMEQLGVPKQFCCDMSHPVAIFKELQGKKTPLELLCLMKKILDSISQTVNTHLTSRDVTAPAQPTQLLTTDDVIPLLMATIIQALPPHLVSILYYIEHFHWSTSPADNLSYSLVTFQAATQHIQHINGEQLIQQHIPNTSNTDSKHSEQQARSSASPSGTEEKRNTRLERQLDRINRMFKSSTIADAEPSTVLTPPARPLNMQRSRSRQGQNEQLGSFLSSLKSDSLHSSFGKQS